MWQLIASFIGGPIVNGLIETYKAKLSSENTADKIAADLAQRELAVQEAEIQAQNQLRVAEVGHPWEPDKLFEYSALSFFAKIVIWDTMLGWGTTPALHGWADSTATLIVGAMFTKRGVENLMRIWKRK